MRESRIHLEVLDDAAAEGPDEGLGGREHRLDDGGLGGGGADQLQHLVLPGMAVERHSGIGQDIVELRGVGDLLEPFRQVDAVVVHDLDEVPVVVAVEPQVGLGHLLWAPSRRSVVHPGPDRGTVGGSAPGGGQESVTFGRHRRLRFVWCAPGRPPGRAGCPTGRRPVLQARGSRWPAHSRGGRC